jgi:thioredoxin-dependent adenylylsulfate APS reductase
MKLTMEEARDWAAKLEGESAEAVLRWALERFHPRMALSNSFQLEDMAVLDIAWKINPQVGVFTLDTGRLHQETYDMMDRVRRRYDLKLDILVPDASEVRAMVEQKGANLFYESVDNRHECCNVRKVRPLRRHLANFDAWVTGLRRDQWASRTNVSKVEIDEANGGVLKINPIADWSWEKLEAYTDGHNVPKHKLYSMSYSSIGCLPCTRATEPGENPRAGRWWWEQTDTKECGLHARR